MNHSRIGIPLFLGIACLLIVGGLTTCTSFQFPTLPQEQQTISIVLSDQASELETFAARELQHYLGRLYPHNRFQIHHTWNMDQPSILLGAIGNAEFLRPFVNADDLVVPESFVVTTGVQNHRQVGVVAGADALGTLYAVYALLEKLGFGFYLSYETIPEAKSGPLDFKGWQRIDEPVVGERFVLNWHNFMSGCSSWNLEDWQHWITQLVKMRFNTIMVHAYGNNPMEVFSHNGKTKPVGYLTTTRFGRDWGTQHVNDVRRLWGGEAVFRQPVFGSNAAMVPEEKRVEAAVSLMQSTFAFAQSRGMKIIFALDVDTLSSNPQSILRTLPASALITVRDAVIANPDTQEGHAYFKSRISTLMQTYPQITRIALWFRRTTGTSLGTIWRAIQPDHFPASWKEEYQQVCSQNPSVADDKDSPSLFAIGKVAKTFRKVLREIGRDDVALSAGSWGFDYLPASHVFFPQEVSILPLDYTVNLVDERITRHVHSVSVKRKVGPIVWAHHDDHTYIGRPYLPFANYGSYLKKHDLSSLGIIHWTTRPLDLYFKNMSQQVWKGTLDESIEDTSYAMAERSFGPALRETMGKYLVDWIHHAPMFGRETTDRFIDRPLKNAEELMAGCRTRLDTLNAIDTQALRPDRKSRLEYYKQLEAFCIDFYNTQTRLDQSKSYIAKNQLNQGYTAIEKCHPEKVIQHYARFSSIDGITPGEKGLLVSLNLRWYPYFMGWRQSLRYDPIRINFQPTQHDPLAQAPGHHTFYVDARKNWWIGLGRKETGLNTFKIPGNIQASSAVEREIGQTGVRSMYPAQLHVLPFAGKRLPDGNYQLLLLFAEPEFKQAGQRLFDIRILSRNEDNLLFPLVKERIDVVQRGREAGRIVKVMNQVSVRQGTLIIELIPIRGEAILNGLVLSPVQLSQRFYE